MQKSVYVWNETAEQINKRYKTLGVMLPVSVNVSRVDIFNPLLKSDLKDIIMRNGIPEDKLLLEITESAYTDNSDQIIAALNAPRQEGFKIETDDFGSGCSSLNMLTSMPPDPLKLDMSFIKNQKACRLVSIITDIARLPEVPIVAEGVETREQSELLKKPGCASYRVIICRPINLKS